MKVIQYITSCLSYFSPVDQVSYSLYQYFSREYSRICDVVAGLINGDLDTKNTYTLFQLSDSNNVRFTTYASKIQLSVNSYLSAEDDIDSVLEITDIDGTNHSVDYQSLAEQFGSMCDTLYITMEAYRSLYKKSTSGLAVAQNFLNLISIKLKDKIGGIPDLISSIYNVLADTSLDDHTILEGINSITSVSDAMTDPASTLNLSPDETSIGQYTGVNPFIAWCSSIDIDWSSPLSLLEAADKAICNIVTSVFKGLYTGITWLTNTVGSWFNEQFVDPVDVKTDGEEYRYFAEHSSKCFVTGTFPKLPVSTTGGFVDVDGYSFARESVGLGNLPFGQIDSSSTKFITLGHCCYKVNQFDGINVFNDGVLHSGAFVDRYVAPLDITSISNLSTFSKDTFGECADACRQFGAALDAYPNKDESEVRVYHGLILTQMLAFGLLTIYTRLSSIYGYFTLRNAPLTDIALALNAEVDMNASIGIADWSHDTDSGSEIVNGVLNSIKGLVNDLNNIIEYAQSVVKGSSRILPLLPLYNDVVPCADGNPLAGLLTVDASKNSVTNTDILNAILLDFACIYGKRDSTGNIVNIYQNTSWYYWNGQWNKVNTSSDDPDPGFSLTDEVKRGYHVISISTPSGSVGVCAYCLGFANQILGMFGAQSVSSKLAAGYSADYAIVPYFEGASYPDLTDNIVSHVVSDSEHANNFGSLLTTLTLVAAAVVASVYLGPKILSLVKKVTSAKYLFNGSQASYAKAVLSGDAAEASRLYKVLKKAKLTISASSVVTGAAGYLAGTAKSILFDDMSLSSIGPNASDIASAVNNSFDSDNIIDPIIAVIKNN